jgi:hypothetical protein
MQFFASRIREATVELLTQIAGVGFTTVLLAWWSRLSACSHGLKARATASSPGMSGVLKLTPGSETNRLTRKRS